MRRIPFGRFDVRVALTAHFRRACGAAEVHKGAVLSGRLDLPVLANGA